MVVLILTYRSKIWTQKKAKIKNEKMNFERKNQIRKATPTEELNIFNLNNKIIKYRYSGNIV
jgi:hypothetical protein